MHRIETIINNYSSSENQGKYTADDAIKDIKAFINQKYFK
jgi:hypothetical protein